MEIAHLSDDELFAHAKSICDQRSQLLARLLLVLIEIEERRLHERKACASIFVFCRDKLAMSEPAAFRRSAAAKLVREFAQPRRCSAPSGEGTFICRICSSCVGT